jgi:quercetin dioxygenase-like cupin family protein
MTLRQRWPALALALYAAGVAGCRQVPAQQAPRAASAQGAQAKVVVTQSIPSMDGARLGVRLVEVTYPPGGSSTPHRHPCAVIGYIISGAMRMQVQGQREATYAAGATFYEAPNDIHAVSANASDTEPAKFLAYFLCDRETPLTIPVPDSNPKERE